MNSGIYLLQNNENLIRMTEEAYDSEYLLQEILAKYPDLLAGDQINQSSPRRWLFIAREVGIPDEEDGANRWSLDHLFLDQDAIPTFVEVKRSDDSRIRRQVVGQMLDYAANATVYWSVDVIKTQFELQCQTRNCEPNDVLATFLDTTIDIDEYWQNVKTNLQAGRIRLIFLADHIPDELRRIVEFLNRQMDPAEVLAIEIPQYTGQGLKCLVPRVMGQIAEAQQKKSGGNLKRQWDELTYFEELRKRNNSIEIQAAQQLLTWAKQSATRIYWGNGKRLGSFVPIIAHNQRDHQLFAVWTSGTVEIYFYWYAYKPPFESEESRLQLLGRLNAIQGIHISEENITRRPSIPLSVFTSPAIMKQFIAVFEWFIDTVKAST